MAGSARRDDGTLPAWRVIGRMVRYRFWYWLVDLLTVVVVWGSGRQRAFCIGALFPLGIGLYATAWFLSYMLFPGSMILLEDLADWMDIAEGVVHVAKTYACCVWGLSLATGSAAVAIRSRLARARGRAGE